MFTLICYMLMNFDAIGGSSRECLRGRLHQFVHNRQFHLKDIPHQCFKNERKKLIKIKFSSRILPPFCTHSHTPHFLLHYKQNNEENCTFFNFNRHAIVATFFLQIASQ